MLAAGAGNAKPTPDVDAVAVLTRELLMLVPGLRPPLPSTFNQSLLFLRPPALTLPPPPLTLTLPPTVLSSPALFPCPRRALGVLPSPCAGATTDNSGGWCGCFCGLVGSLNSPPNDRVVAMRRCLRMSEGHYQKQEGCMVTYYTVTYLQCILLYNG